MKKYIFIFILLISFNSIADTYEAIANIYYTYSTFFGTSYTDLCPKIRDYGGTSNNTYSYGGYCNLRDSSEVSLGSVFMNAPSGYSCPAGGTISGTNCIDAPACISPSTRNLVTRLCYVPLTCDYPETDDGSGICQNNTCPSGQSRNPTTNLCQVVPVCGSTETYDIYSNTCKLYPLNCPGHSHANSLNDTCLPDAPNACPVGQHDDGTYTCVADDAKACKSNQQYGLINGIPQCVSKTNAEQAAKTAQDAKEALEAKKVAEATALAAKNAAQTDLNSDPTNTTKQAALTSATNSYETAKTETITAQTQYTEKRSDQDSDTLKSIDQTLKGSGVSTDISPNSGSEIQTLYNSLGADMKTDQVDYFETVDTSSFIIATESCIGVSMNYKSLNYEFNPCAKLALWRELFGWFCYVWTAFSIISLYRQGAN